MSDAPVAHRCTKLVSFKRTQEVRNMLMRGLATATIVQDLSEKWGITERAIYKYIVKVNQEMDAVGRMHTIGARVAQRRGQLENLYEKCVLGKDYKTAALVMDRLCRIDGAFAPSTTVHDVRHRIANYTPEERAKRLDQLQKLRTEFIDAEFEEKETAQLPENAEEEE